MLTVYLADLRHNYRGVLSVDCMPLGVGYMKAVMDRDLPAGEVRTELFAYPSELLTALKSDPPDVLLLSNYVWNEALGLHCLKRAREINPRVLTVMGGPNFPVEAAQRTEFMEQRPEIDIYAVGEADFLACDIVRQFLECGASVEALRRRNLVSCVWRREGSIVHSAPAARTASSSLADIPSPWLTGVLDRFFDGKLAPLIETNRGCPFACSFCVQGTAYYHKLAQFPLDRIREEVDYIARMIRRRSPGVGTLRIADANYGMYPRDTEISGFLGKAQRDHGWPTFIDATTGKNRAENVIRSMEQVSGGMVLYQAVQSLDEDVLRRVRRSNIRLSAYAAIAVHLRGRGLRSSTDLILGLPGDTLESHLATLHKMIDLGTDQAHCFQAMMLKGSDMETRATREEFKFETRFRLGPKNFGEYDGHKVFDVEEIVVSTDSLSFDDYVECRKHHMTFSVFWNDSWFSDLAAVVRRFGVKNSEWLTGMLRAMENDRGAMGRFLRDFEAETKSELFPTEAECVAFYSAPHRFQQVCRGRIGDNLMYKYRALASFFLWDQVSALAMRATKSLLRSRGAADEIPGFDELWEDLHAYIRARHATGTNLEKSTLPVFVAMRYDIPGWLADGAPVDVERYRFAEPRTYVFRLTPEGANELAGALSVWTRQPLGLSKLITRIRYTAQVRQCESVPAQEPAACQAAAAG